MPRLHVICLLGGETWYHAIENLLNKARWAGIRFDEEYSQCEADPAMDKSFHIACDRGNYSMEEEDWEAVRSHAAVAYLVADLSDGTDDCMQLAARMLDLISTFLQEGAVAAKVESSGIAHGRDAWISMARDYAAADSTAARGNLLYRAFVRRPISSGLLLYSTGMHLLGLPDLELLLSHAEAADEDTLELACETGLAWFDHLGVYLAGDRPSRELKTGEGFRQSAQSERRIIQIVPCCERHSEGDLFYNPKGYVRLVRPEPLEVPVRKKPAAANSAVLRKRPAAGSASQTEEGEAMALDGASQTSGSG